MAWEHLLSTKLRPLRRPRSWAKSDRLRQFTQEMRCSLARDPVPKHRSHAQTKVPPLRTGEGVQLGKPARLRLQLVGDRQAADSLAGGGEDRVRQRRSERRNPRLADSRRMRVNPMLDDMDTGLERSIANPGQLEAVEVVLLDPAVLEGEFAIESKPCSHHAGAFPLSAHPFG